MGKQYIITIKKNSIIYFFMIIPFVPISYLFNLIPYFSTIYLVARIFVILILLFRLFTTRRKFTVPLGLTILFIIVSFFSTLMAGVSEYTLLYYSIYLLGLTLLIEDGVYFDVDAFINGCMLWFEILIYANLLYFFINPDGYILVDQPDRTSTYYLMGNYNATVRSVFPGVILSTIHAFKIKNRITLRFCCMFLALLFFIIRVGSMTSLFGLLIYAIALLFYMWRKKSGIFKFEYFIIISVALTYIFAISGRFHIFENIITQILGRNMTLTGRTTIWARTLLEIAKRPIWGHGQLNEEATRALLGGALDPHNVYLGSLFYGGIIGLAVLVIILLVILRKIRRGRKDCPQMAMIFDAGCCAYFIMWNFEPFAHISDFYHIFMFFIMAFYCINFANGIKKCNGSIVDKI